MRIDSEPGGAALVETIESGPRTVANNTETVVIARIGDATAWDVYIDVPAAWIATTVTMKIYGRSGGERKEIASFALSSAAAPGVAFAGDICAIRGVPVTAIEVAIHQTSGLPLSDGKLRLRAWTGDEQRLVAPAPKLQWLKSAPVRLFDGTNEVGTSALPLGTRATRPGRTYSATTTTTSTGTSTGTVNQAILWAGNSPSNGAEIVRVSISHAGGEPNAGGQLSFVVGSIGSVTSPTSAKTTVSWNGAAPANAWTLYGAATIGTTNGDLFGAVVDPLQASVVVWEPGADQAFLLPKGEAVGIVVRSIVGGAGLKTSSQVVVSVQWVELLP